MAMLEPLQPRLTIIKPLTSYTDPVFSVSYVPSPPEFTIRTIIDAINSPSASSSHPFTATLHHPPTLEERARYMHAHEQRALLIRLIFSVIVAIPTFIIGVVYMSLVPHSDHVRMWWMRPMWAGNASRVQWALFFLATPVMFYSAGLYHKRSLKELWALWRKGSRVPIWKRFVRFGSMNLLVSTGVSVAYFSSIALLALAASQQASPDGQGDSTTYFDSVVLLTMFLLAGQFILLLLLISVTDLLVSRSLSRSLQQGSYCRRDNRAWQAQTRHSSSGEPSFTYHVRKAVHPGLLTIIIPRPREGLSEYREL